MVITKRKYSTWKILLFLLLLGLLDHIFMAPFNSRDVLCSQENTKNHNVSALSHGKQASVISEEKGDDIFIYQIKKAEILYNHIIFEAADLNDVDLTIIKAIIMAESGFNKEVVSHRGAGGLMQLMPGTAKSLGVKDIYNPEENIHAGVKYFKYLLNRFNGDIKLALAAYNAGAGNVRKYNGVPPFKETRQFIRKVLVYRHFYRHGTVSEITIL